MFTTNSSAPVQYRVDFRSEFADLRIVEPDSARQQLFAIANGNTDGLIFGAFITGPVGAGKTYAMQAVRREPRMRAVTNAWIDWPEFVDDLYEYDRRSKAHAPSDWHRFEPLSWLLRFDGDVYLDDVGAERDQFGIATAALQRIVAGRCKMPHHLFVTTNLSTLAFASKYGERTESRLMQHVAVIEVPSAADRRLVDA